MPRKVVAVRDAASVAVLPVTQFAAYSRFAQPPNYIDSDTPPLNFPLRLSFGIIVRRSCFAIGTKRHQKYPGLFDVGGHVHLWFDDGDGFFNPARRAFAALRLSAYSLPSSGATCGGSLSRYGRPIPSSFSCASIHFHRISLDAHLSARVSPFTLTRSAASPWP